jgi:hypothetical protein
MLLKSSEFGKRRSIKGRNPRIFKKSGEKDGKDLS